MSDTPPRRWTFEVHQDQHPLYFATGHVEYLTGPTTVTASGPLPDGRHVVADLRVDDLNHLHPFDDDTLATFVLAHPDRIVQWTEP